MTPAIRLTQPTRTPLHALLNAPKQETYGQQLRTATGLSTATNPSTRPATTNPSR